MKKTKDKKNKEKSYRLWKFCVASDEKQTENLEQASAFLMKIFTATLWTPFKLLNTSEEEAKGLQLNTQRSGERSVAAIANNNRNTEKQICRRAKPKGGRLARSLLFFSCPSAQNDCLARFSAVGLASGHQNWVFIPPAPWPWPGF